MPAIDLGPVGVSVNLSADDSHLADAAELEQLGYSAIWVAGGQLAGGLDPLAKLARATSSAYVVPGIIQLDAHGLPAVTDLYAELEASAPGRFVLGLGGPQQAASPLQAMNEFLDGLDAAGVPTGRRLLAALGPRKLALARDRFAGAVTLLVTPDYTEWARTVLGPEATLVVNQVAVLDTDASRARETARGPMRFLLGGVAGYAASARRAGFTDDEIDGLADRLVDSLAVWGDVDAIAARLQEQRKAGADHVVVSVFAEGDQPTTLPVARQLADTALR